ncbi:hypothetical protein F2Q70_00036212 [Brassica cretica]|uniref:Uncharacterized protein n=1 Tax=Brassica cretica TaxID=69181 RepID=A0A8S9JQ79_BRACR|nr:hypothetical protein F2Q70_00036212 [Brassica cretica]
MPTSTRSKKETQMLLSSYPASFERSIRKGRGASSINNNPCSSLVSRQPPSTQTPASSTNTPSPPSTEDTPPSTDIFHPTSIDTSVRTSIDTEPRDMVATLILVHEDNGDLHYQERHLQITPASGFQVHASRFRVPASRFRVPALGSGCCLQLPASRPSDLSCLRLNGNLPLIRKYVAICHRGPAPGRQISLITAMRIPDQEFLLQSGATDHLQQISIDTSDLHQPNLRVLPFIDMQGKDPESS